MQHPIRTAMRLPVVQLAVALLCVLACAQMMAVSGAPSSAAASKQSYYDLLGVTRESAGDALTLKRAYRKLALVHHPDKAQSDGDREEKQATFVRLANAYEVLSNRRLRVRYDHLLSRGQYEYDGTRDWDDFDVANGFKRKPQTKAQKEAAFRFKTAQEMFRRAADEAEEFALWTALGVAAAVALLPAAWMFYSRHAAAKEAVAQRKARSGDLKATQAALAELQAEQKRTEARQREEERDRQRELRRQRDVAAYEAAQEAKEARAAKAAAGDDESAAAADWEIVKGAEAEGDDAPAGDHDEDSSSEDERAPKSGSVIKCVLCKKSFKSQQQMENHENSNQHKKAVQAAERGAKKKAKRDE